MLNLPGKGLCKSSIRLHHFPEAGFPHGGHGPVLNLIELLKAWAGKRPAGLGEANLLFLFSCLKEYVSLPFQLLDHRVDGLLGNQPGLGNLLLRASLILIQRVKSHGGVIAQPMPFGHRGIEFVLPAKTGAQQLHLLADGHQLHSF